MLKKTLLRKSILSACILMIICTLCLSDCFAVEYDSESSIEDIYQKQIIAVKKNTELLNSFIDYDNNSTVDYEYNYPDNYGGSYINDDNNLVIKLTENNPVSRKIVTDVIDNVIVEKCEYSYGKLSAASNTIMEKLDNYNYGLKYDDYSKDVKGCAIDDEYNIIKVYIDNLDESKILWFKNKIDNSSYISFEEFEGSINEEVLYSGQGFKLPVQGGNYLFSSAFRVIRTIDTGRQYGFITCAHGLNVGDIVRNDSGDAIGTVRLRKYEGAYDISYVQLYSKSGYSNTIFNSPYTLNNTNDDLCRPVKNQLVYFYSRYDYDVFGKITSTNVSFNYNGRTFSGLIGANYPSREGDSGGLICTVPNNQSCNPVGIHKGVFGEYKVFTSAANAINLWYLNRY